MDEKRALGPHYSAGFLIAWVVNPGWDGSGIPLRDEKDRVAALRAGETGEPFAVLEKDDVANRLVGTFRCAGIDGGRMSVAAA